MEKLQVPQGVTSLSALMPSSLLSFLSGNTSTHPAPPYSPSALHYAALFSTALRIRERRFLSREPVRRRRKARTTTTTTATNRAP